MTTIPEAQEISLSDEYSVVRGGRLYDKWFKINESGVKPEGAPPLGKLANKNPWEVLHKIRMGQPNAEMSALYSLDVQISVDILTYLRVLPRE